VWRKNNPLHISDLTGFDTSIFRNNTELEELDLSYYVSMGKNRGVLSGLRRLKRLVLKFAGLRVIDADLFTGLLELQELVLYGNELEAFPVNGTFKRLAASLKKLDLSYTSVSGELGVGLLEGLVSLEEINLDFNKVTSIHVDAFTGLSELKEIKLKSNQLSWIEPGTFRALGKLESLYLNYNKLDGSFNVSEHNGLNPFCRIYT
jgi:Leucine-rich repeat (LRR) protein